MTKQALREMLSGACAGVAVQVVPAGARTVWTKHEWKEKTRAVGKPDRYVGPSLEGREFRCSRDAYLDGLKKESV